MLCVGEIMSIGGNKKCSKVTCKLIVYICVMKMWCNVVNSSKPKILYLYIKKYAKNESVENLKYILYVNVTYKFCTINNIIG